MPTPSFGKLATAPTKLVLLTITGNDHLLCLAPPRRTALMQHHGPAFDQHVAHLDTTQVQPGDCVIGTLPVNLAAQVCARQATYLHLSLDIPAQARGQELSAEQLQTLGATLQQFHVQSHKVKPAP